MDAETLARDFYQSQLGLGLGAQFMAVLFDSLFAGVLVCQLTHWLPNVKRDAVHVRYIAGFGAAAALATTLFTWVNYTSTFVLEFGHYARFASLQDLGWYAFLDILSVIPVQLIFAERSVKVNGRSPLVFVVDGLLIVGTLAAALGVVVVTRGQTIFDATKITKIFLLLWPSICALTHLTLTATIIFGLWQCRQGLPHSARVVDRLIYTLLESQLPATAFALAVTTTIAVNPKSAIIPWIIIVHPKVFIVGCIAMLNTRHTWQKQGKLPGSSGSHYSSQSTSSPGKNTSHGSSNESAPPGTPDMHLIALPTLAQHNAKSKPKQDCGLDTELGHSQGWESNVSLADKQQV